jgi:hypothetical protein
MMMAGFAILNGVVHTLKKRTSLNALITGRTNESSFILSAAIWGYGTLMTISTIVIHRYYLLITFPLEFVWLARLVRNRKFLTAVCVCEFLISAAFLYYIHVNHGAPNADYGIGYQYR